MVWGTISEHVVLEIMKKKEKRKRKKRKKERQDCRDFVLCGVNKRLVTGVCV